MTNDRADVRTILVVDDQADNRRIAATYLAHAGYHVLEAGDGATGMQLAIELCPDLVLMDISLPNVDGVEALRQLRAHTATAHMLVVAYTAHAMEGDREQFLERGFDGYLAKPLDPRDLLKAVHTWIGPSESQASDDAPAERVDYLNRR